MGLDEKDIIVIGAYGVSNFGDDLLAIYVLGQICETVSPGRLIVSAPEKCYLEKWFRGIRCIPYNRLYKSIKQKSYKLIFGGGGQFFAFPPYSINNWYGFKKCKSYRHWKGMRRLGWENVRIYGFCLGIGPLDGFGAKLAAKFLISNFEQISVRDKISLDTLCKIGIDKGRLVADCSIGLINKFTKDTIGCYDNTVGIIIREWPYSSQVTEFMRKLVGMAKKLRQQKIEVRFISFQPSFDKKIIDALKNTGEDVLLWDPNNENIFDFGKKLSRYEILVTMRAHGVYLACFMGNIPVGINIEPKIEVSIKRFGLENNLVSFDSSIDEIIETIHMAKDDRKVIEFNSDIKSLNIESTRLKHWLEN